MSERASEPMPHTSRRRTDPDNSWHPEDDDDRPEATAKRARMALAAVAALQAESARHGSALTALTSSVDRLTGTIALLVRLIRWAGAIAGGVIVVGATGYAIRWFVTLHH